MADVHRLALSGADIAPNNQRVIFNVQPGALQDGAESSNVKCELHRHGDDSRQRTDSNGDSRDATTTGVGELFFDQLDEALDDGYLMHDITPVKAQ